MRTTLSLLAASLLICLSGCGGSYGASSTPGPNTLTGDWSLVTTGTALQIGGYLQNNSGTITGTLHITNSTTCFPFNAATGSMPSTPENIAVTGTLTGTTLSISGTAANTGQILTISGTTNSNSTALTSGTFSITNGCGSTTGSITGNQDDSFTSTAWSGTMTSNGAVGTSTISANLVQGGPDVNGNGLFTVVNGPVTTPVSFTANSGTPTPCFATGSISALTVISGNYVFITITTNSGTLALTGSTTFTGTPISGTYSVSGGPCNNDSGTFTLSHP